jgi:hypothetical protein
MACSPAPQAKEQWSLHHGFAPIVDSSQNRKYIFNFINHIKLKSNRCIAGNERNTVYIGDEIYEKKLVISV